MWQVLTEMNRGQGELFKSLVEASRSQQPQEAIDKAVQRF